ncbi:MAG: hypothetical protein NWE93_11650 [Candidatus Bathyarchaeota archaeon]|nr:hypothetical protein [Candidatus Bathyarchaeota archaeon]
MKRKIMLAAAIALLIIVAAALFVTTGLFNAEDDGFYVGVTFGGDQVSDAKQLIDKVKGYTNLFVLLSGEMQDNITAIDEVGDYAVNSGLHFIVYFGTDKAYLLKTWLEAYDGRWNQSFLGFYYGDELCGKMLDGERQFYGEPDKGESFMKYADGKISGYQLITTSGTASLTYFPDGAINARNLSAPQSFDGETFATYYPNGTVTSTTVTYGEKSRTVPYGPNVPYTYEQLWSARPLQSSDEAAQKIVSSTNHILNSYPKANYTYLTSDYALHWFDYLGGYDAVLAQLGWNQTVEKDIGLVRGAANMQNRSWGTIITWKYTQAPYLAGGQEVYDQMRTSYECGAKYVVVFNYAENMTGPYGTLQEEHFGALERFWRDVVQNPLVGYGSVKAEAAFVLPKNCGWGLRNIDDTVWGLWTPSEEYRQFWPRLQDALAKHGGRLDIIYDDPAYPFTDKYSQVYFWNQTG